jgi:xanthine dehydrogenase small subunit
MTSPVATVNGRACSLDGVLPHTSALDWLRAQGLTGAKEGCAEGECGACAVLVARPDGADRTQWSAVNSCLVPALGLDGQEVVTSEGLGSPERLHPVQQEMAVRGGSQCGYCTPGFVCSMAAEYYRGTRHAADDGQDATHEEAPKKGPEEALQVGPNGFDVHALSGNLCRCTGYRPIRDAAFALGEPPSDDALATRLGDPAPAPVPTRVASATGTYARAADLDEALALLHEHPEAVLVAGATDWGVEVNLRAARPSFVIAIDRVPELRTFEAGPESIEVGAALTLSEIEAALDRTPVPLLSAVLPQFASRLIRNSATIGGNIGTASPIGDLPPALLALDATVLLSSTEGDREVAVADYFTGYRETVRRPGELIRSVRIPLPLAATTAFHKIAKRRFDDISSVAVAMALTVRDGVVAGARIGLGGVTATPIRAQATESALEGRPWNAETVRAAAAVMRGEGTPMDDHRASAAYRAAMLGTALLRLYEDDTTNGDSANEEVGA